MKSGFWGEIEIKIIGATYPAARVAVNAIVARITKRNDTASASIGITIAPTIDTMIMSFMSMTVVARRVGGEVGHGIDIDRARHEQTENTTSVPISHTAQPDPHRPQPQTAMGTLDLHRE